MKNLSFLVAFACAVTAVLPAQDLLTFGGTHTQLYGYRDYRYVGPDKGDYLKTLAWYSGAEYVQKGFETSEGEANNLVLGGALVLYVQDDFAPRTLYAVKGHGKNIRERIVPSSLDDRAARFQVAGSFFGGFSDQWWGAEGGLSAFAKGFEEKTRRKYSRLGIEVDTAGRGWVFGNGSLILPNFLFRFGALELPHFELTLFRGHYDPGYGALQARVLLPFQEAFQLAVGGSLVQTSSIFVEPTVGLGAVKVSVRAGTILNYNDSDFTRVGILEGAFVSGAVGYRW